MYSEELENIFKVYGDIISCKVSLNEDHSSRGYGFVCFKEPENATKALLQTQTRKETIGVKFAPRNKADFRKVFNNIFIKNIPDEWTEADLKKQFSAFGDISSTFMTKSPVGMFAFVCYGTETDRDPEYGPRAAAHAVQEMDNKQFGEKKLYVRPALKRSEREKELAHERLKYQISKKRCNLYVKNFPPETTEQDLFTLFSSYGEIDSIKLYG